jgi:hypothetical protein
VGPRAGLDAEVGGKILCLCGGSNPGRVIALAAVITTETHSVDSCRNSLLKDTILILRWPKVSAGLSNKQGVPLQLSMDLSKENKTSAAPVLLERGVLSVLGTLQRSTSSVVAPLWLVGEFMSCEDRPLGYLVQRLVILCGTSFLFV